jgi:hypothetical protein
MPVVEEIDPFELPDWLGTADVTWSSYGPINAGHRVAGALTVGNDSLTCDLMAVDEAYPVPVLAEEWRSRSHRAWRHNQVLLLRIDGRVTLAVPGTRFSADLALEVFGRLARAVGAAPRRFVVALRA